MQTILAVGAPEFARLMQMGGATARLADDASVSAILAEALADQAVGLVLLDPGLAASADAALRQAGRAAVEKVLVVQEGSTPFLRRRIRQVVGADLMATETGTDA